MRYKYCHCNDLLGRCAGHLYFVEESEALRGDLCGIA